MRLEYKIWFWDYRFDKYVTHTNSTPLAELPILGVAAIANVLREPGIPPRWCIEWKCDFYCFMRDRTWWGKDLSGLYNYIDGHRGDGFAVLRGGMVPNQDFSGIYRLVSGDPELTAVTTEEYKRRMVSYGSA